MLLFTIYWSCFDVQLFYMGLTIFVPATATEAMIDFPLWGSVVITGTVATIYTTLVSQCSAVLLAAHTHTYTRFLFKRLIFPELLQVTLGQSQKVL